MAKVGEGRTRTRRGGKEAHAVLALGLLDGALGLGDLDQRLVVQVVRVSMLVVVVPFPVRLERADRDGSKCRVRVREHALRARAGAGSAAREHNW